MTDEKEKIQYCSFLLRVWREDGGGEPSATQIEVESVQTGKKWRFRDLELLMATLQEFSQFMEEDKETIEIEAGSIRLS